MKFAGRVEGKLNVKFFFKSRFCCDLCGQLIIGVNDESKTIFVAKRVVVLERGI